MMKKSFVLIVILSLSGSYSFSVPAINKQYHSYLVVAEDKSPTLYLQDNLGIVPLITEVKVFRKTEQLAPNFAGACPIFTSDGKKVAAHRQKLKPVGLMEKRNTIKPSHQNLVVPSGRGISTNVVTDEILERMPAVA